MPIYKIYMPPTSRPKTYDEKIKSLFGSSLIGYWMNNDKSGTVALDSSGNGRNGTHSNITLLQDGIGDGLTSAAYNGTTSKTDIYSASLNSAFDGNEGAFIVWMKPVDATLWADTTFRCLLQIYVNGSNFVRLSAQTGLLTFNQAAGGTSKAKTYQVPVGLTGWMRCTFSWSLSGNEAKVWINDNRVSNPLTGLGTYTGALSSTLTLIGAQLTNTAIWKGCLAHIAVLNRPITDAEVVEMGFSLTRRFTFIGDSISVGGDNFPAMLAPGYGRALINNHAVGSSTILDNATPAADLASQVSASVIDNANTIIIHLGTNDDNAGNMTTLQAKVEENISIIKASNPHATIYWLNVLPRWTNTGGGTVVDKSNIRAAIAAACTAQGITCIDPFTTPVITSGETSDGLHPTVAGARKICQLLWSEIP